MMHIQQIETEKSYALRPCTIVYVALIGLTLVTSMVGRMGLSGLDVSLLVLSLALLKGLLIGDYYMGLSAVRSFWRLSIIIWLLLPGGLITWAFVNSA